MEQNHRHIWKVDGPSDDFYSHFHLLNIHIPEDDDNREMCLHEIGLEIYGRVSEDWTGPYDSTSDQIQRLEAQNIWLEAQNEKLEARVKELESKLGI